MQIHIMMLDQDLERGQVVQGVHMKDFNGEVYDVSISWYVRVKEI